MTTQSISSSQYTQLLSMFTSQGYSSSQAVSYLNSIFTDAYAIAKGNHQERSAATENLCQVVMNVVLKLLRSLISNEASRATQDVNGQNSQISSTNSNIGKSGNELKISLSEFEKDSLSQQDIVEKATAALDERNKRIEQEQKEADEIIENIKTKQAALEAASSNPEKASEILKEIQEFSDQLQEHLTTIATLSTEITELGEIATNAFDKMEDIRNDAETKEAEFVKEQQEQMVQLQNEGENAVETLTEGCTNETNSVTLGTAAVAASSNIFTAASAGKLEESSADQGSAAITRIGGSINNFTKLAQGIGSLTSDNTTLLGSFANAIGMNDTDFSNLIGSFNNIIEPSIKSLGSFENLNDYVSQLNNAISKDNSSIEEFKSNGNSEYEDNLTKETELGPQKTNINLNPRKITFKTPEVQLN